MSKREEVLTALTSRLKTLAVPVVRNEALPQKIPDTGMVFIRDGDMGTPEVLLSPVLYVYQHSVDVEVVVQDPDTTVRDKLTDGLLESIGKLITSDPTLGGVVDYAHFGMPEILQEQIEGAPTLKAVIVTIILEYASTTPFN